MVGRRRIQIVMEFCGGGAVKDIVQILDTPLREDQIAFVCREALKVHLCEFECRWRRKRPNS